MSPYTGIFKSHYHLSGRDWVRLLTPEDRRIFVKMGMEAWEYGHKGGLARAQSCNRDSRGRFAKSQ